MASGSLKAILYALGAEEMVAAINLVEQRIQEKWTSAKWVFFEPDVS